MPILINIDVDNLASAVAFYTAAVDLRLARYLFDGSVAELTGAGCSIYLLEKPAGTTPAPGVTASRNYHRHWTPVHLDFVVEDVEAAVGRAIAAGSVLEGKIENYVWGKQATFSDPFGHGFCLIQSSEQGYSAVACAVAEKK